MHIRTRRRQEDGPTLTVSIYYDDVLERDDGQSGNCDTGHAHVHECVRAAAEFAGTHHEQKAVCEDYDYCVQAAVCDASDKHGTDVKAGHRHSGVREGVNDYDDGVCYDDDVCYDGDGVLRRRRRVLLRRRRVRQRGRQS